MDTPQSNEERGLVAPIMMIAIGSILLVSRFVPDFGFDKLWPLLLIAGGVAALFGRR